jgi:ATP-dependent DNA helicase RecQ
VRSLEVLQERELIELRVSDARNRYTRLQAEVDAEALVQELSSRFLNRETAETKRIQSVLDLVTHEDCQTNALVGYFGEVRDTPCGHCTFCLTTRRMKLPPPRELPPIPDRLAETVIALRAENPEALGDPRQIARFLCGLTSPALTRARLSRHELFGAEEARPFAEVMEWAKKETVSANP